MNKTYTLDFSFSNLVYYFIAYFALAVTTVMAGVVVVVRVYGVVDFSSDIVDCNFTVADLDVSSLIVDIGKEVVDDVTEMSEVKAVDVELEQFLSSYEL